MQAIITKYVCPTNTHGSRIRAKCQAKTISLPWNDELNVEDNHKVACARLCTLIDDECAVKYGKTAKRHWSQRKVCGQIPSGEYVHVFVEG